MPHSKKISLLFVASLLFSTALPAFSAGKVTAVTLLKENESVSTPVLPTPTPELPTIDPEPTPNPDDHNEPPSVEIPEPELPAPDPEPTEPETPLPDEDQEVEDQPEDDEPMAESLTEIPVHVDPPLDSEKADGKGIALLNSLGLGGLGSLLGGLLPIIIRPGFTRQPAKNQYVPYGASVGLRVRMVGVSSALHDPWLTMVKWTLQPDGTFKKTEYKDKISVRGSYNRHHANVIVGPESNTNALKPLLTPGVHFFQLTGRGYGGYPFHSKLARVNVVKEDVAATDLEIETEKDVVWSNIDYEAAAHLNPTDSTSKVRWYSPQNSAGDQEDEKNPVSIIPSDGREPGFTITDNLYNSDKGPNQINESTEFAGFPVTLTATTEGHTASKTVYAGGLKAQEVTKTQVATDGVRWPIFGLDKFEEEYYNPHARAGDDLYTLSSTNFKWHYYLSDANGSFRGADKKNFSSSVENASGTINNPEELNTTKALHIPKGDEFFKIAAGRKIAAYVTMELVFSGKKERKFTFNSNLAALKVVPDKEPVDPGEPGEPEVPGEPGEPGDGDHQNEKLILTKVPEFDFHKLTSATVYQGTDQLSENQKPISKKDANNILEVTDTRQNSNQWELLVTLEKFEDASNQTLNRASLNLLGLPSEGQIKLDSNDWTTVMTSDQYKKGGFPLRARLSMAPNPKLNLKDSPDFQSVLSWTLIEAKPEVPTL